MGKSLILLAISLFAAMPSLWAQIDGMTREQFREYKQNYLIKELGMRDDIAKKFFPIYENFQEQKQKIYTEYQALMDKADVATEAEYRAIIERLQELDKQTDRLEASFFAELKTFLTYEQIFKLNKAESKFQKHILRELTRQNKGKAGK